MSSVPIYTARLPFAFGSPSYDYIAKEQAVDHTTPRLYLTIQALNLPKSNLEITQGLKSRAKTIAVAAPGSWVGGNGGEEECLERVKAYLNKATEA